MIKFLKILQLNRAILSKFNVAQTGFREKILMVQVVQYWCKETLIKQQATL
tara:strand:- start:13 stop:165 length:153 start_codon:yes stop_codon:yes gene_type:complete